MKLKQTLSLGFVLLLAAQAADAAIALDRTRAIFDGSQKSISLNIRNDNTQLPYLAQSWLEDSNGQKITDPLVVVPPVQRVEPGAKSQIRINAMAGVAKLPQDRESVFYFNVREIPPRSTKQNVMQIALQTKIKLFYRPAPIAIDSDVIWQEKVVLTKVGDGYQIHNPTPYYLTVIGISGQAKSDSANDFRPVMVPPKSTLKAVSPVYATPYVTYINDFGGRPELKFTCNGSECCAVANQG